MAGVKAFCVVLYLCPRSSRGLAAAGKQEGTPHHAIKRQRPRSDERFTRKCRRMGGLVHDVMYFMRMRKA